MLQKVKGFLNLLLKGKSKAHYERTIFWMKKLDPKADEALLIAAYSHDIERILRKDKLKKFDSGPVLLQHQTDGGKIMYDFLIKNGASHLLARKVQRLIARHEVGGTSNQNLLKDADSISLLENNIEKAIKNFPKEEVKKKIELTYQKISSSKAKKFAKPFYEKAKRLLE